MQSAKDKSQFGKGDVRGLIAPEAANNSVKGGDLVPTVAFGIPGSAAMAILLGAFLIQGLTPGPEMLTTKLHITFSMMWTLIFANIIGALLLMAWANQLQKIIFVPANLILPGITFFVLIGAWTAGNNIGDWITLLVFGVVGLVMKRAGWPRAPLILGFILGRIMENSLHISMQAYGLGFILRPICLAILAAIVITIFYAVRSHLRLKARHQHGGDLGRRSGRTEALARPRRRHLPGADLRDRGRVRLAADGAAVSAGVQHSRAAAGGVCGLFRLAVGPAGAGEPRGCSGRRRDSRGIPLEVVRSFNFFAWLAGVVLVTVLLGQHVALPAFIALYLLVWGGYGWKVALSYAAAGLGILIVLFDYMSPTLWYPALLLRWW